MKVFIISLLFNFALLPVMAQQQILLFNKTNADTITDKLQTKYVVYKQGAIKKINAKGDSVAYYKGSSKFDLLYSVEVSNPFRIILYYADYGAVIYLNQYLQPMQSFSFSDYGFSFIKAVAASTDNNLWFYDPSDFKLKKINERGTVLLSGPDLSKLVGVILSPVKLEQQDQKIYLYDLAEGLFIFDLNGAFIEKKAWMPDLK